MRSVLTIAMSFVLFSSSRAQAPAIEWQSGYPGVGHELFYSGAPMNDGGFVFVGQNDVTDGAVWEDMWVVKTNAQGATEWELTIGGSADERGRRIRGTVDGGAIMVAFTASTDGDASAGSGGGGDFWVVKLAANGGLEWARRFGGSGEEDPTDVIQTSDGGYLVAGKCGGVNDGDVSGGHGVGDAWLVKLDPSGDLLWQRPYGGTGNDVFMMAKQLEDDGYICAGWTASNDGDVSGAHEGYGDAWVVRLNSSGDIVWQRCVGGSEFDNATAVAVTDNGQFMVAGGTGSIDGDLTGDPGVAGVWLFRLDAEGELLWTHTYGSDQSDYCWTMDKTTDGDFVVVNQVDPGDAWVLKVDGAGELLWERTLGGSSLDLLYDVQATPDGGCILAGLVYSFDGDALNNVQPGPAWAVKFHADGPMAAQGGAGESGSITLATSSEAWRISAPDPFQDAMITVTDAQGRVVRSEAFTGFEHIIPAAGLATGGYALRLCTGDECRSWRLVRE